ncbi:hypothetical protein ACWCYL_26070 [Streptomyces sp. 900105755]|uniref:hypothetical protein n=1 Tax=Streptomyces sp. 900105755 TaxID=3154389 RepID=UPI0033188D64
MDSQDQVCPACGQPVERVVRRHKTLGAWVPVWGPGPCRNPDCAQYPGPSRTREAPPPAPSPPESAGRPTP